MNTVWTMLSNHKQFQLIFFTIYLLQKTRTNSLIPSVFLTTLTLNHRISETTANILLLFQPSLPNQSSRPDLSQSLLLDALLLGAMLSVAVLVVMLALTARSVLLIFRHLHILIVFILSLLPLL